jgi:hypothetical protein
MSSDTVQVSTEHKTPTSDSEAQAFLRDVVDGEIDRFSEVLAARSDGEALASFEREILRAYLWWRLVK